MMFCRPKLRFALQKLKSYSGLLWNSARLMPFLKGLVLQVGLHINLYCFELVLENWRSYFVMKHCLRSLIVVCGDFVMHILISSIFVPNLQFLYLKDHLTHLQNLKGQTGTSLKPKWRRRSACYLFINIDFLHLWAICFSYSPCFDSRRKTRSWMVMLLWTNFSGIYTTMLMRTQEEPWANLL